MNEWINLFSIELAADWTIISIGLTNNQVKKKRKSYWIRFWIAWNHFFFWGNYRSRCFFFKCAKWHKRYNDPSANSTINFFFVWMKKMSAMRVAVIRMTSQKSNTNRTFHTLFVPLSLHLLLRMHMCLFGLHISILHVACSTQYLSSYFVCIWVLHLLSPLSVIVIIRIMIVIIINVFIVYMFDRNWCHPRTPSQQCFWTGLAVNVKIK